MIGGRVEGHDTMYDDVLDRDARPVDDDVAFNDEVPAILRANDDGQTLGGVVHPTCELSSGHRASLLDQRKRIVGTPASRR